MELLKNKIMQCCTRIL